MKRVWRCDYCSATRVDKKETQGHEEKCSFNPANKSCYSCKHHDSGVPTISGNIESCFAGVDSETMWGLKEDDLPCEQWAGE